MPSRELLARREAMTAVSSRYFMRTKTCRSLSQMRGRIMRVGEATLPIRYELG